MTTTTDDWAKKLGVKLITVRLLIKGEFFDEKHVDDTYTLPDTIRMSLERLGGWQAVFRDVERSGWTRFDRRKNEIKTYPTKEAAEMVALHRG